MIISSPAQKKHAEYNYGIIMGDDWSDIHVFKTNIRQENLGFFSQLFGKNKAIRQWNVDTEDCDLVLRIVSSELSDDDIILLVCRHGFECADLH